MARVITKPRYRNQALHRLYGAVGDEEFAEGVCTAQALASLGRDDLMEYFSYDEVASAHLTAK
eukprot:1240617-Amphidinium_carterae.1